jgi:CRISPR-associated protein Csx3
MIHQNQGNPGAGAAPGGKEGGPAPGKGAQAILVEVVIGGNGIIAPSQLIEILRRLPEAGGTEGVIVSGRLPVWAYASICHHFHPRPFVATFEPRLNKGVVVQTHVNDVSIGDLVEVPEKKVVVNFP